MPTVNLTEIKKLTRQLARVPTAAHITDDELIQKINLAYTLEFPSELQLSSLRKEFTFFTQPGVDVYDTNTIYSDSPLYNFKNTVITSSAPIFIAGYPVDFNQSRSEFFARWPITQYREQVDTGDGVTLEFSGTLNQLPILKENVQFTSKTIQNQGVGLTGFPVLDILYGYPTQSGNLYDVNGPYDTTPTSVIAGNTINYITGVFDITFEIAPADNEPIYANYTPYVAGRPISVLWFDNKFTLRPVPDGVYPVVIEAQVPPTELMNNNDMPELDQWFEYIAFLSAIKICESRNDMETIQILMPSKEKYERQVERRSLRQKSNKRSATIFNSPSSNYMRRNAWWQSW